MTLLTFCCWATAVKQSIDISWLPGPQQQIRHSSMLTDRTDEQTERQTDIQQLHILWEQYEKQHGPTNQPACTEPYEQLYDCRHCNGLSYNYNASHADKNTQCYLLLAVSQHPYNGTVSVHLSVPSINSSSDVQHAIRPIWHLILSHQTVFLATMVEVFFSLHLGRQPSAS